MRPIKLGPYTPAVASTTAFNAQTFNSTGAATAPTTTSTTDGLAHYVTLTSPAQATLAGITFTILGTDPDGHTITDTVTGPASASTTTSTKFFKTITTITPSATMGALVLSIGSAIMGPQVFEKSLSCVNNLRLQDGRAIVRDHTIFVVDLQDGGHWDWTQGEPPKDNPAYYLRFCKSFSRMGGAMHYAQCDNIAFVHHLLHQLQNCP